MLQSVSSVFVVYRRKTLTGSPDPTHTNGTDKPCIIGGESSLYVLFTEDKTRKEAEITRKQGKYWFRLCKSEYLVRE